MGRGGGGLVAAVSFDDDTCCWHEDGAGVAARGVVGWGIDPACGCGGERPVSVSTEVSGDDSVGDSVPHRGDEVVSKDVTLFGVVEDGRNVWSAYEGDDAVVVGVADVGGGLNFGG